MTKDPNNPSYIADIQSNNTRKHWRESALMTAAHILVCLIKQGKSHEEIAREDFDNNLEMVSVWIDYMIGINWIYKNTNGSNKWIATHNGKKWVEKIYSIIMKGKQLLYLIMLLNTSRHRVLPDIFITKSRKLSSSAASSS